MHRTLTSAVFMALATSATADIIVTFNEGAPKDRFTFQNVSDCALTSATLSVDLNGSAGALVFDTTDKGAGVEVFQPFELVAGKAFVTDHSTVSDGEKVLTINVKNLKAGGKIAFTIDVDDTLGQREITVNDAEISGATASTQVSGATEVATFNGSRAVIPLDCAS
jgi:hypothetical protein